MSDPYNPVTLSRYYYTRRISSRRVSITSNPTRTCRTLSRRLRTKSPRSNEDDTEEKTLALYPKVQIRAFVPRISSLTREGRWSRNQVWPGPSSGHCQVFVAPPFRPWRRKMLFRPPAVRSSSRDRPRRTNPCTGRMVVSHTHSQVYVRAGWSGWTRYSPGSFCPLKYV
jgi:hypothetical protein